MDMPGDKPPYDACSPHELLTRAIARVRRGALPRESSPAVLAGPGQNERCALCDAAIAASSVEYEMTSARPDGTAGSFSFHIPCFHAWQQACLAPPDSSAFMAATSSTNE